MSDSRLRDLERRWKASGAVEDEGALLSERVRTGQLEHWALIQMALEGNTGARFAEPVFSESVKFPRAREFFENILHYVREARATLDHYRLVVEGDKAPPSTGATIELLFEHLKSNPRHIEAIHLMQKPVFQLIPVYEHEGVGFQRMVTALDINQMEGDQNTYISDQLRSRWGMNEGASGKIKDWQVAITEGAKVLPRESNPYAGQPLEDQLTQWQENCKTRDLLLCNQKYYMLLQMQELMREQSEHCLPPLGIDCENWTVLEDVTRKPGLFPGGEWEGRVSFNEYDPASQDDADVSFEDDDPYLEEWYLDDAELYSKYPPKYSPAYQNDAGGSFRQRHADPSCEDARFRPSMVVKKIL